jgi:tetratricopeptide (TPR) repeat protein
MLKPEEKPTAGNLKADNAVIECWFGDILDLLYLDELSSNAAGKSEQLLTVKVVIGTDGKLAAFSKSFGDEALAVETQFHIAESHFELFKSHKALQRDAEGHKWGPKMAFRIGQCYHKDKQYSKAGDAFDRFAKQFHDDALASDALFWAGESFRMANNNKEAFVRYNKCRWDFPSSEAAKFARGRLALPEMLRQFEEASQLDNK